MSTAIQGSDAEPPLSEKQLAAVVSNDRAIAVIASAGSGKTEVVARRAQRLLQESGDDGQRILALSYTRKAADELHSRLEKRLGRLTNNVEVDTVHGFAHGLVRRHGTKIGLPIEPELLVRDEDRIELFTRWFLEQAREVPSDIEVELRGLDLLRARNRTSPLLEEWQAALENASALDYPALLSSARSLLESKSTRRQLSRLYAHVIVDEAQNLTPAQYDLLTALIGAPGSLTMESAMLVGDDKQSIVSFAGADPGLIQRFVAEYGATVFELTTNYRSATELSKLANRISEAFGQLPDTDAELDHGASGLIVFRDASDESDEAELVASWIKGLLDDGIPEDALAYSESASVSPDEVAVLGRSAASLRGVAKALDARSIPYMTASSSGEWLDTTTAKIALEIVGLRADSSHQSVHWQLARLLEVDSSRVTSVDTLRVVLAASRNPLWEGLARLCDVDTVREFVAGVISLNLSQSADTSQLAAWLADVEQLRDCWSEFAAATEQAALTWGNFKLFCSRKQRGDDVVPGVRLLTIHKAQGREFRAVSVVGLNDGQLPDFRAKSEADRLAELRAFYVAVTRARRVLLLTRAASRLTSYGSRQTTPSPYLAFLKSGAS